MKRSMIIPALSLAAILAIAGSQARADFDNPNYTYYKVLDLPANNVSAESQFSPDGSKILWTQREFDPTIGKNISYAIKYADWNPVTKTISNIVTMDSSSSPNGNPVYISGAKWSPDGSTVAYMKCDPAWTNQATQLWRYDVSTTNKAVFYAPASGTDAANPDFYGSNGKMVFWDSSSGQADLFSYDGSALVRLTNSTDRKEYEPRILGTDTSKILYWSGETTGEPYNSVHILNTGDNTVTDVALGSAGHNLYWPVWGKNQDYIAVVDLMGSGNTDLLLYKKNLDGSWSFSEDLTGDGYEGGNWNFFGGFDASGSFCFNSGFDGTGRDIWVAQVPEPATMSLLALGGLALIRRRRAAR